MSIIIAIYSNFIRIKLTKLNENKNTQENRRWDLSVGKKHNHIIGKDN